MLTRKDLVVGLVAVLLAVWGLTSRAHDSGNAATTVDNGADTELYSAIVERMRAGEPYYRAAGTELSAQGYATLPVTNLVTARFRPRSMKNVPSVTRNDGMPVLTTRYPLMNPTASATTSDTSTPTHMLAVNW